MTDLSRWQGKVVLVTGASSGIGRSVALRLARANLRCAVIARRSERLEELRREHPGGEFLPLTADLRRESEILAAFSRIREIWGGVDVLINNAGVGHLAPLANGSTEHWREMLEVNVLALCVCTREALSDMRRRGDSGHVIHISSMSGHRVPAESGVYSATKYAVRSLTEGLRQELRELGSGIRISAVSPGTVETEFAARYLASEEAARDSYASFQVLTSDDVADVVAYVLSLPPHVQIHDVLLRPRDQPT